MRGWWMVVCLVVWSVASEAGPVVIVRPSDHLDTARFPSERDVLACFDHAYKSPQLHHIDHSEKHGQMTLWFRSYAGIPITAVATTSPNGTGFVTRYKPELVEPAAPQRNRLLSPTAACARVAAQKCIDATLHYLPSYADVQIPGTHGTNAADFYQVVDKFRLAYRVSVDRYAAYEVDAYTGDVISKPNRDPF